MEHTVPLLSVIIPVYNGSAYIDGLLAQFREQETEGVELVFIDDGSQDDSWQILLDRKAKKDLPMAVYHQENTGVSTARNLGLEMAQGRYVSFVDVDDGLSPDYLSCLKSYIRQDADVLVYRSQRIRESDPAAEAGQIPAAQVRDRLSMLKAFLADPTLLSACNLLLRRELLESHQIRFSVGYAYYEDYDFLLQVLAQTDGIRYLDHVLYYYILRDGSAMGRFSAERINCLGLMQARGRWLETTVPEFAPLFKRWGVPRLYWSVLWQAALAMPAYRDFAAFAKATFAEEYLKKLDGHPDQLLQISTKVFLRCRPAYHLAVRLVGRHKSKVQPVQVLTLLDQIRQPARYFE